MKRIIFCILSLAAVCCISCKKPVEEPDGKVTEVTVTPATAEVEIETSITLEVKVEPSSITSYNVSWSSSDKNVATISRKGVLLGVAPGEAVITAEVEGVQGTCKVKVFKNETPVSGVALDQTSLTIEFGNTEKLTATVSPDNAADKTVTWSSSDENIATVKDGVVTTVGKGECDIKVKTNNGGKEATCHVKVTCDVDLYKIALSGGEWAKNSYPIFNKECTRAYFVTLHNSGTARKLYEINLETKALGWCYDLTNQTKNWSNNGGDMCVNPKTGDIICCDQCTVFAITKDGKKKWELPVAGLTPDNTTGAISGCGPAMSNECSVIFAPLSKGLTAIDASTGAILDTYSCNCGALQFAVYGNDDIVLLRSSAPGIVFLSFADSKFTQVATLESPTKSLSDITSPAVTKDQKKVYFCGTKATVCVDLDSKTVTCDDIAAHGEGYRWAPCITSDGYLTMNCVFSGSQAAVIAIDSKQPFSNDNFTKVFAYDGYNSALNFEGCCVDKEDNVYFFINDCASTKSSYLYRATRGASGYDVKALIKLPSVPQGTYQASFNIGGKYVIAIQGTPATINIMELETSRGDGWAGPGGDIFGTKNANLVW